MDAKSEKPDLACWLGRSVRVVVDRQMGSVHPRYPNSEPYPINYGYIPGTVSGDGEAIDAYVIGPLRAVEEAAGTVVAVIIRLDDNEDKLVVSSQENTPTEMEIRVIVAFQERYFNTKIVMNMP